MSAGRCGGTGRFSRLGSDAVSHRRSHELGNRAASRTDGAVVVLIRNLAVQGQAAEEVMELLEDINDILGEIDEMQRQGKPL